MPIEIPGETLKFSTASAEKQCSRCKRYFHVFKLRQSNGIIYKSCPHCNYVLSKYNVEDIAKITAQVNNAQAEKIVSIEVEGFHSKVKNFFHRFASLKLGALRKSAREEKVESNLIYANEEIKRRASKQKCKNCGRRFDKPYYDNKTKSQAKSRHPLCPFCCVEIPVVKRV